MTHYSSFPLHFLHWLISEATFNYSRASFLLYFFLENSIRLHLHTELMESKIESFHRIFDREEIRSLYFRKFMRSSCRCFYCIISAVTNCEYTAFASFDFGRISIEAAASAIKPSKSYNRQLCRFSISRSVCASSPHIFLLFFVSPAFIAEHVQWLRHHHFGVHGKTFRIKFDSKVWVECESEIRNYWCH